VLSPLSHKKCLRKQAFLLYWRGKMSGTVVLMERKNVCQFSVLEPYLTILPVLSVKTRYRASVIDKAPSRTEQFIFQFLQVQLEMTEIPLALHYYAISKNFKERKQAYLLPNKT
jgi:hypothetical protein